MTLRALSAAAAADNHALADCSSDHARAAVEGFLAAAPAAAPAAGLPAAGAPIDVLRAVGLLRYVGADVDLGLAGTAAATTTGAAGALRTAVAERGLGLPTAAAGAGA